jgi:hypothetical protein
VTTRKVQKRRLERAGFRFHSGWLPETNPAGARFDAQVEAFRPDVEALQAEGPLPRGWPKGKPRKPPERVTLY